MPHSLFQSLGNHEFDIGVSGLTPFIESLNCPVLSANLILSKVPELAKLTNLKNSIVLDVSDTKVGIIGYLTPETKQVAMKNDVEYIDEVIAIQKEVNKLQNEGVNIIIALGHSGYIMDQKIAKEIEGLDLVIGGHSHSFLWNGSSPDSEQPEGPYPTYIKQTSGKIVPVVQAYAYTKYLGKIRLSFNSQGELISSDGTPILLDNSVPQDRDITRILERYGREVEQVTNVIVGNTTVNLDGRHCHKKECNLGNLITDAMVDFYASEYSGEHWTDAPIAMLQAGSIRASLNYPHLPTTITVGELMTVMPFKGALATVLMNGTTLLEVLEHSVANDEDPRGREFLQYSGMKVVYDYNKPAGQRVIKALARCWTCNIPEYFKVDSKEMYKVILPDIIRQGGDGFSMLPNLPGHVLPYNELNSTLYYVRRYSPIRPEVEGRIIIHHKHVHKGSASLTPSVLLILLALFKFY